MAPLQHNMIHDYTLEQQTEINLAIRKLHRTGVPEIAIRMQLKIDDSASFAEVIKVANDHFKPEVKPEVPVADLPDAPPFTGKGSGTAPWRSFAKQVSDMDPEIIDSMGRKDIITVLKDKGIVSE